MKAVGIRDLKNKLSEYIRLARGGEEILVTDRGEVVAELRSPSRSDITAPFPGLLDLARQGNVRLGAPNDSALYPRLTALLPAENVSRLLDEERGEV